MRNAAFLLFCLIAACAPLAPIQPYPGVAPELATCGGLALLPLIGGPVAALPDSGGWETLRIIHPGDAVTEDFSWTRLNVEVDAQDRIQRLSCG